MRISDWSSDVCSSDLQVRGGTPVVYLPRVAKDQAELARLVGLRDAARQVLAVQVDGGNDDQLTAAQAILADRYRSYTRLYGPINRSSQARTRRRNVETGEEVMLPGRPRMGGFREGPVWALVAAPVVLERS